MKRFLWIAVLALSACDKPAPSPSTGSAPGPSTGPAPSDASAPADSSTPETGTRRPPEPEPIRPRVYVTANDSDSSRIPAGWPLLVQVSVHAPLNGSMKIAAASGPWSTLLRLTPPGPEWKLRAADMTATSITLGDSSYGLLLWTMTAEELDAIPRGTYRIQALLESAQSVDGSWKGTARGAPAVVTLVKAIAKPTEEQEVTRSRLQASVLHLRGDVPGAEREADALLKRFPKNPLAILLRVDLLQAAGKRKEALAFLDAAIQEATGQNPTEENWPRDLVRRREDLAAMEEKE
jgi:hypothetical protein